MATTTGGYAEAITQPEAITKTIIDLSDDLRAQYMLGFVPANAFLNADGVHAYLSFLNESGDTKVVSEPRMYAPAA